MFVVPIPGDTVSTRNGVDRVVLSYAPYRDAPAVFVESEGKPEALLFSDITAINGTAVNPGSGKILVSVGRVKRKVQLPQKGDEVKTASETLRVRALKLNDHGKLSHGMQITGETGAGSMVTVPLSAVVSLDGSRSEAQQLLKTYADYLGSAK